MFDDEILLRTGRFNLSKPKSHYINECCFGDDFAAWMKTKLAEKGISADDPEQEDWGWYLDAKHEGSSYMIGFSGNSDEDQTRPDYGEWHVMIKRDRSLKDKLLGRNKDVSGIAKIVEDILRAEPDFSVD